VRLPRGADLLADIRRQGYRPEWPVHLFLDADRPRPTIYSDMPLEIEVCIKPADRIADLDLWPLAGLSVAVHAGAITDRLRELLRAIVAARPAFIGGACPAEHCLFAWSERTGWQFDRVTDDD
jgi:hypothetical protein